MSWLTDWFKSALPSSLVIGRERLVTQLAEDLLSQDSYTRNTAVDVALNLASEGNDCVLEGIEEAIRRRHGNTDCEFYELSRGPRVYDQADGKAAGAELLELAVNAQLWVRPPVEIQRLIARYAIIGNLADLLKEIEKRAGEEQAHAFQLLGTHLQAKAKLTKARETALRDSEAPCAGETQQEGGGDADKPRASP